jgi:hypothetical protein
MLDCANRGPVKMSRRSPGRRQSAKRLPLSVLVRKAEQFDKTNQFVANHEHARIVWEALNHAVFNGVLEFPEKIIIQDRKKWDFWGECEGWQRGHRYGPHYTKAIRLQKTYLDPKRFIDVMAHEMVHQYEWERQGVMTHGKTFWAWKEKLAEKGIPLTSSFA